MLNQCRTGGFTTRHPFLTRTYADGAEKRMCGKYPLKAPERLIIIVPHSTKAAIG